MVEVRLYFHAQNESLVAFAFCVSSRYLDYGDAEWKKQTNEALKSLET